MPDIEKIAAEADVIIDGYAFTRFNQRIRVVNLHCPDQVAVFSSEGLILETTMNDIALSIVSTHLSSAQKYMED